MFKVPNKYRLRTHPQLGSDDSCGNNGFFILKYEGYQVNCQASDGAGWEHVSVSINKRRCPAWHIMCFVKDIFWDEEDTVIQFHSAKSEYVNNHPFVLHLWRRIGSIVELPPSILVGYKKT